MIQIRKKPPVPDCLSSSDVGARRVRESIREQIDAGIAPSFPNLWIVDEVRGVLWRHQHKKCCYCERKRDQKREPDIEHFRPKGKVTEEAGHAGYWWLAYRWSNLFFACRTCNQAYKKNHFPLAATGVRAWKPADKLSREEPVLLNPIADDPERHLHYDWHFGPIPLAKAYGSDERGRKTVEVLGLDRDELNEDRGSLLVLLNALATSMQVARVTGNTVLVEQVRKRIGDQTRASQRFAGFRRAFFSKMDLADCVAHDS